MSIKGSSLSQKLLGTFASSSLVMLIQIIILLSRSRNFSEIDQGMTALFVINIDLIAHLSMIVGGSALVYLSSRHAIPKLMFPSYVWAVIASGIGFGLLYFLDQVPKQYAVLVFLTGFLQSLFVANQQLILGRNNIRMYNFIQIVHNAILLIVLILLLNHDGASFSDFLCAYFCAISVSFLLSLFVLKPLINERKMSENSVLKDLISLGLTVSIGALAQRINSRLNVYILNSSFLFGTAMVGLFSTGQAIIEKLMVISRSFSSVQYADISNNRDEIKAQKLTINFMKLSLYITLLANLILILIPERFYLLIIGEQWEGIHDIILYLSPAVLILSISNIFSHYFSGLGLYKVNSISAILGLVITIILGFILIPEYGINGCILTITVSYFAKTLYQIFRFYSHRKFSIQDWVLTKEDLETLKRK